MVDFLLHDENLIFSLFATFPPVDDAIKINEKFEIHFSPSCNQYNMMRYWPHWTNNQIICDWQNVLSYLFWILFFTIASISIFFLLIFIYEQRAHKTLNIIYKHKSNQITQLLQNKTNSDEAIFHYWSSSHIRIHTVAGDFIRSNFVLCVQEHGTWFVVGRGLWAHLSAFLLVICYRIHIIAAHFVRHVSSPDIIHRNMCESSSTRSLSFNICFLRSDSSSRVVLPLLIYPWKCHCFRFKQKLI